jgi:uncharacterized coiled-coil DUF342 family protein
MSKITERLNKHDKQIAAIRDLVKEGMRMIIETRKDIRDTRKDIHDTRKDIRRLEVSLQALIDSLRRTGGNGRSKAPVDLQ